MLRLSELLERIRPAGSPGAAAEGDEQHRRTMLDAEIADVARQLAAFEREADELVADARADAERIRADGERRVEQIAAGRADRIARARASVIDEDREDVEPAAILDETRRRADRLVQDATERLPTVTSTIVDSIWSMLPSESRP